MSISKSDITDAMRLAMHRQPALRPPPNTPASASKRPPVPLEAQKRAETADRVIAVFIPCSIPTTTAQQKGVSVRNGKPIFYTKKKVRDAENHFAHILAPYVPSTPFQGPLCLCLKLAFPWLKNDKRRKLYREYPIETRPDVENLAKAILDQMTQLGFWVDDSQLSTLKLEKVRSDNPGITLNLTRDLATKRDGQIR